MAMHLRKGEMIYFLLAMLFCIGYTPGMDWRDLQTFLVTAQAGSTQAAARETGLDQSTISRRIGAFEHAVGQRLFERLPTGLVLTPAGEAMLATARDVEDQVHALERRLMGEDADLSGEIRLTVPPYTMDVFLGAILSDFHRQYPDVHVEVDVSMTEASLTKREADIAVRGSNNPPEHLIGRKAATYHVALYAHREHASKGLEQDWIGWGTTGEMEAWARELDVPVHGRIWHADEMGAQLSLAAQGMGIAALPVMVGDAHPDLVRLHEGKSWPNRDIWVLTHRDLLRSPRVRTLFNTLADGIKAHSACFRGEAPFPKPQL